MNCISEDRLAIARGELFAEAAIAKAFGKPSDPAIDRMLDLLDYLEGVKDDF